MTGATVSSRAVTGLVYKIAHTYTVNRKEIVKELSKAANK
jgi:Na+-translocating ferredoxin:NAD+ oxidoreductase RnfG subunit